MSTADGAPSEDSHGRGLTRAGLDEAVRMCSDQPRSAMPLRVDELRVST